MPVAEGSDKSDKSDRSDESDESDESEHPTGCHSDSPRSRLAEPMTGGEWSVNIIRPLWSHKHIQVRPQGSWGWAVIDPSFIGLTPSNGG